MRRGGLYAYVEEQAARDLPAPRGRRDPAGRQPVRRGHRPARVAGCGRLHQAPHLAADDPARHAGGGDVAAGAPGGRDHPPGREPRERAAGRGRPADRPRHARAVLRGPLQLLPGELPRVRAAAARGPRSPLGPLVAGVRRGRRRRSRRAGALVSTVLPENAAGHEGSYVEYIGVHRNARGRGVAKALLHTVIADAAQRGRDRVGLEVDADSPTGADGLYASMGWETDYVTESWFKELDRRLRMRRPREAIRGRPRGRAERLARYVVARSAWSPTASCTSCSGGWRSSSPSGTTARTPAPRARCTSWPSSRSARSLVWAVAVGMFLLVVWRVIEAAFGHREDEGGDRAPQATEVGAQGRASTAPWASPRSRSPSAPGAPAARRRLAGHHRQGDGLAGRPVAGGRGRARRSSGTACAWSGAAGRRSSPRTWRPRASWAQRGGVPGPRPGRLHRQGHRDRIVGALFCYAGIDHEPRRAAASTRPCSRCCSSRSGPTSSSRSGVGFACYGLFCFARARHLDR